MFINDFKTSLISILNFIRANRNYQKDNKPMKRTTKTITSFGRLLRNIFKIILLVILLSTLLVITILYHGYRAASIPVSYLPEFKDLNLRSKTYDKKKLEINCSWYKLLVDEFGNVSVTTLDGESILSNLKHYSSYVGATNHWGLKNISVKLCSDSTISIVGEGSFRVMKNISLTVQKNKPELKININTRYSVNTIVNREALVASFAVPVNKVFKKNRQIDSTSLDPEYWLENQGVSFGNKLRSALIYHTPYVSSLQLDTKTNVLFVNLEYDLDHPFIHIPFQENGEGKWDDVSKTSYVAGAERNNSFSIWFGDTHQIVPRIMLVPNGYLAGYVFTEHADGGTLKQNRAAYFGSENISKINDATGGFAGHKIPVTKSIFYTDPGFTSGCSILDTPDSPQFLDFIDQLHKTGDYEICLHTPDDEDASRKILQESIKFMKERFNTSTWIDHRMYSGDSNRESIVADGLNSNSIHFAADLWEQYGTHYFWSPAVEMIRNYSLIENLKKFRFNEVSENLWKRYFSPEEINNLKLNIAIYEMVKRYLNKGEMNSHLPYKGNAYPTPLFWPYPQTSIKFYSWVTDFSKEVSNLSEKKVNIEEKLLNKLITDRGIFINHGYFARNGSKDNVLINKNGKILINPYFDRILELMANMRDKGDLYITTIKDLLDYWVQIENISFEYLPNGVVTVYNNGIEPIKGLSLAVNAGTVRVNGETPKFRKVDDDIVFWFDISAGDHVLLEIR